MTSSDMCKKQHRALFLALSADCKLFPGGISSLAVQLGINKTSLANQLNPDHESKPPTFANFLELILLTGGHRSLFSVCHMNGFIPMPIDISDKDEKTAIDSFFRFVHCVSEVLGAGSEYAADGRIDAHERNALEPMLIAGIQASCDLLRTLRS